MPPEQIRPDMLFRIHWPWIALAAFATGFACGFALAAYAS